MASCRSTLNLMKVPCILSKRNISSANLKLSASLLNNFNYAVFNKRYFASDDSLGIDPDAMNWNGQAGFQNIGFLAQAITTGTDEQEIRIQARQIAQQVTIQDLESDDDDDDNGALMPQPAHGNTVRTAMVHTGDIVEVVSQQLTSNILSTVKVVSDKKGSNKVIIGNPMDDDGDDDYKDDHKVDKYGNVYKPKDDKKLGQSSPLNQASNDLMKLNIFEIMAVEDLKDSFIGYVKKEYAIENVNFIDHVCELQQLIEAYQNNIDIENEAKQQEEIDDKIRFIYDAFVDQDNDSYIDPETKRPFICVNLPYTMGQSLKIHYEFNYWPHYSLRMKHAFFNKACRECATLLTKGNALQEYRNSKQLKKLNNNEKQSGKIFKKIEKAEVRTFKDRDAEEALMKIRGKIKKAPKTDEAKQRVIKDIKDIKLDLFLKKE